MHYIIVTKDEEIYTGEHECVHIAAKAREDGTQVDYIHTFPGTPNERKPISTTTTTRISLNTVPALFVEDRDLWVGRPSYDFDGKLKRVWPVEPAKDEREPKHPKRRPRK